MRIEDGRVGGAPDARAIRFYQTTGVLDRPLRYDGRRAVYSYRHLLQILAIKRLQAEGYPLSMIQASLPAKTTGELERAMKSASPAGGVSVGSGNDAPPARPSPRLVVSAELAPGVTVTIDPSQVPDPESLIRRLAASAASVGSKED